MKVKEVIKRLLDMNQDEHIAVDVYTAEDVILTAENPLDFNDIEGVLIELQGIFDTTNQQAFWLEHRLNKF